jgi:hypothetical protein
VRTEGVAPLTHPGWPFDPDEDRWGEVYQRASVANATNYEYRLGGTCTPVGEDEPVLVRQSAYADGVAEYSRSNVDGTVTRDAGPVFARIVDGGSTSPSVAQSRRGVPDVREVLVPEGRVGMLEVRAADAVERLFATPNSTVRLVRVNSSARYLLTGSGRPPGFPVDVGNYSLAARVRHDGLLEAFTVAYTRDSGTARAVVSVSVEYHDVGRTTVDPPGWFEAAGGAAGFQVEPTDPTNATLLAPRRCGLPVPDG